MSHIFRYFPFTYGNDDHECQLQDKKNHKYSNELVNCSLVNSHWLYHAWNINSIYYLNLNQLISQILKHNINENEKEKDIYNVIRMWQRVINAKHIYFVTSELDTNITDLLLSKLSLLRNVEKLECVLGLANHLKIVQTILQHCQNKIKWYDSLLLNMDDMPRDLRQREKEKLSFTLNNAQYIKISHACFNILWSDKCQMLELHGFQKISSNWCNYVINNCDCSNIKCLYFNHNVSFSLNNYFNNYNNRLLILKQLAFKFYNLCD